MARLVLTFLALSLLMVGIVGAASYLRARNSLETQVFDRLDAAGQLKADSVDRWIDEQRRNVVFVGGLLGGYISGDASGLGEASQAVLAGGPQAARGTLAHTTVLTALNYVVSQTADAQEYLVVDPGGKVVVSTVAGHEGRSQSKEEWFERGSSRTYVEPVQPSSLTGRPTITIATPLFDRDGQQVGIVAANLNLERLDRIVLPVAGLGQTGESYLVGRNGHFVHAARDIGEFADGASSPGIESAIAGTDGRGMYENYRGVPVIGVYRWLPEIGAGLVAEQSEEAAFAPARTLALTIGGVGILVAFLLGIGTYLAARRIARPILAITDTAQAVAAGDLDREAPVTTNDEVGTLALAFNAMTGRLRETLAGLEQRVADRTEALGKQNVELEALNETSVGVMQRLELGELLGELIERAGAALGTEHGYVYLAGSGEDVVSNRFSTGLFRSEVGRRLHRGEGVAGHVWVTGEPLVVDDYDVWEGRDETFAAGVIGTLAAVPLSSGGDVVGALGLARKVEDSRPFTDTDVDLLQRLAQLASIALDNARLFAEQRQAQSELAAAAEALRQAEEQSRRLIEELPMAVYTDKPDATATSIYISPRVEAMFGYPRDAWMGESFFASVLHPDDRERTLAQGAADLLGSDESTTHEYRLVAADGRVVWVRDDQWIVRDEHGEPLHIQGFMLDVTDEHEAAIEIRRQKQYFESLVEVSPVAVVVTDLDERVEAWNPSAAELFGYPASEAIGRTIDELLLRSDALVEEGLEVRREALTTGRAQRIGQRTRKGGSLVDVEILMVSLVIEEEHTGYYVMYHDIGELQRARQEAEAATEVKSAFLATMSHEIRTPMNAVIGMTGLLLDTGLDEEQKGFAQVISSSGDALLHIIDDILDYSKIEAGRLELDAQPFDLRECIEGSLEILAPRAAVKNVELGCLFADDVPPAVIGDSARLRQVLLNLLSNAVKFTDEGEIVVDVGRGKNGLLHLDVRDTGIGIPADRLDHMFESFSQVDASITRRYGGTGLGLAISKRLVELMGGTITIESEIGKGSTFHVTIVADESSAVAPPRYAQPEQPVLHGKHVLIVDDNATNREILSRQAASWGMVAEADEKPADALLRLRRGETFDVAVLDMQMPDMDGLTLAHEIRVLGGSFPLILATSLGGLHQARSSSEFAAQLAKPVKASQLYEALLDALSGALGLEGAGSKHETRSASGGISALRILIAEDNAVNQKLAMLLLAKLGYAGDLAENGLEVLDALARERYDVVLMDMQMPELDGLGATRRIIEEYGPDRPRIIAMTANAMQGDREECLAAGMDDYVAKPIRPEELAGALARCKPRATFS